ncbi:tyrosine-type recombinase/integrase [Porticoccus sp.]|uniref:tyrosine-type recombinase/integrase n=1 Tax=Porticoccus sp. TaxID=2024853 RepID=UPI000C489455|nr:tyrosine-type recombinase/integrase [Porticoccus sp.]MAZ69090.1 site-specific recombinase [Porticoccus sp.]
MGAISANRIKFSKPNLRAVEKRINQGGFSKELYIYDADSHLAVRAKPNQSYAESVFCLYARIRPRGAAKSKMYKRQIMKVGDARNAEISLAHLRKRADSLFLEIQEGRDPKQLALEEQAKQEAEKQLVGAKRALRDMIYGTPMDNGEDRMRDGFIAERRPSKRYQKEIKDKSNSLLFDLLDEPLYSMTPERVKVVYLNMVPKGQTQLNNAMRILRSIWNWAQSKYDDSGLFVRNPVSRAMKQLGININRTNRRSVRLDETEFGTYLRSVLNLRHHDHTSALRNGRDALLFMLFSGVRLMGTMTLRMADIDLERSQFTIIKKGGEPATLPLNSVTEAIVKNRQGHLPADVEYLFPGVSCRGHYWDTKAVRKIVQEETGIAVTNHDLRRTYKTIGAELAINHILIDELCCHAREGVNAHYIHPSMSALRDASQRIADYILEGAGFDLVVELLEQW